MVKRDIQIKDEQSSRYFVIENNCLPVDTLKCYFPGARELVYMNNNNIIYVHVVNNQLELNENVQEYNVLYSTKINTGNEDNLQSIILNYFQCLYTYKEICHLLKVNHNVNVSERKLKRIVKSLGLRRKNIVETSLESLVRAMIEIHVSSGFNLGYRSVWQRLKTEYKFTVKRSTVLKLLRLIDPQGIEARSKYRLKRRQYSVAGPNHLWHVDGHDKLKKFGFAISGCVDGYSRKVMWLEVATTNNKPEVIANYFLKSILAHNRVPCVVRSDKGTENSIIELIQMALRFHDTDNRAGYNSFLKGKSTANERIEKYWKQLRNHTTEFYMRFFKTMQQSGEFDASNNVHVECLRFCFGPLIQKDLTRSLREWNEHRVRQQNHPKSPCGIPNIIYHWPDRYGGKSFIKLPEKEKINKLFKEFTVTPKLFSDEIKTIIDLVQPGLKMANNLEEAYVNFKNIVVKIELLK
uniref:Integrase core domain-containing protein n=1 Tax=Trichogramma kaykai TaxID=54128 RepID=A0ABD2WMH5_9HYME